MKEGLKELLPCLVIGISAIFLIAITGSILLIWVLVGVMISIAIRRWQKDRRKIKKMTYKESGRRLDYNRERG